MSQLWPIPFSDVILPVAALSVIFAEAFSVLARRRARFLQGLVLIAGLVVGVLLFYATEGTTNPRVLRPVAYFGFVMWSVAVPTALLTAGASIIARIRSTLLRHACLVVLALVVAGFWPFFVLSSLCASGLDCI